MTPDTFMLLATAGTSVCTAGLIWATLLLFWESRDNRRFQERVRAESIAPDVLVYIWADTDSDPDTIFYKLTIENPTDNVAYRFSVAPKHSSEDVYFQVGKYGADRQYRVSEIRSRQVVPPRLKHDAVFWKHGKTGNDSHTPSAGVPCWIVVSFADIQGRCYSKDVFLDDVMIIQDWIKPMNISPMLKLALGE